MTLPSTFRHLARQWRIYLAVLAGMTLGAALLSGLTMYAQVIAGQGLSQSLAVAHPRTRNVEVRGQRLTPELEDDIRTTFGALIDQRLEVREATLGAEQAVYTAGGEARRVNEALYLRLQSFDPFEKYIRLVAGRLPAPAATGEPPVLEAVVGTGAAEQMGLALGDELVSWAPVYRVRVVGIVAPLAPEADVWWGDPNLLSFNVERELGSITDKLYLPLLLDPLAMAADGPEHAVYWRVLLHWEAIALDQAAAIRDGLVELKARSAADAIRVESGLVDWLDRWLGQLAMARVSLLLLTAQSMLAILYVLGALGSYALDQLQGELATMSGRGFGPWQLVRVLALEGALLAFGLAFPLGPLLAYLGFRAWSSATGSAGLRALPGESWLLALLAVTLSWLVWVARLAWATRRNPLEVQRQRSRPVPQAGWQRVPFDLFVLALGGLAYWQLRQTGSFVRQWPGAAGSAGQAAADPALLVGPSLLLLALGIVFARLFPLLLRLAARLAQPLRGLVLPLGLARLARDPAGPNRVILLISLTVGLTFFAGTFRHSIQEQQQTAARELTGADLRVKLPLAADEADSASARIVDLPGVLAGAPTYRAGVRWGVLSQYNVNYTSVNLFAVDPAAFALVAGDSRPVDGRTMPALMSDLEPDEPGVLPVLLSPDAPPPGVAVGDRVRYQIGQHTYEFEVRGFVSEFPTLERPFVVTHLPVLEQQIDLGAMHLFGTGKKELWLKVDPARHAALVDEIESQEVDFAQSAALGTQRIAADAQALLRTFRSDLVARLTTTAFALNAAILVVLSCTAFVLVQALAVHRRLAEFGVLRAIGLSIRQLFTLLAVEGGVVLVLGLLIGTGVGLGLTYVMRPYLGLTLASAIGSKVVQRLLVPWPDVVRLDAALAGFYVLALALALAELVHSNIQRVQRIGDE